jgi:hypothetical protein
MSPIDTAQQDELRQAAIGVMLLNCGRSFAIACFGTRISCE